MSRNRRERITTSVSRRSLGLWAGWEWSHTLLVVLAVVTTFVGYQYSVFRTQNTLLAQQKLLINHSIDMRKIAANTRKVNELEKVREASEPLAVFQTNEE